VHLREVLRQGPVDPHGQHQDVARMTGLSVHTLSSWRFNGGPGPSHFKLGKRVFYRQTDVEQWLERASSSQAND
jgi:hypothetical protein